VIPQLRDWHARYEASGLTIVGVHTPESWWEQSYTRVVAATKKLGIAYPVVQDNDFVVWHRYSLRTWPSAVVVDKMGIVRFTRSGEGGYTEMERLILSLLDEPPQRP